MLKNATSMMRLLVCFRLTLVIRASRSALESLPFWSLVSLSSASSSLLHPYISHLSSFSIRDNRRGLLLRGHRIMPFAIRLSPLLIILLS